MTEKKIREAGDKTKGFTLQKQRAIALFFDEVKSNPNTHVNVAIEYKGDVYLQNDQSGYVEEQKNYNEEKAFSFNSHQILNTLAYFLEIWLAEGKSQNIKFGFYSTSKIAQENSTRKSKILDITFPSDGLLKKVADHNLTEDNVLEIVRKILVQEYVKQYSVDIRHELDDTSLTTFINSINWYFEQDNEKEYRGEVLKKIKDSEFASSFTNSYQPDFVYAALMLALEEKQDEVDIILKFLQKASVEILFLKVSAGQEINIRAHKYLHIDQSDLIKKQQIWLKTFLENKYFSNVKDKSFPKLIERKVAKHNKEIKILRKNLEQTDPEKAQYLDVVVKSLGDLINDSRPTFLFGEIGSGKSTLLAHHFLNELEGEILPIFIPSTYLKGKVPTDLKTLKSIINAFVNDELNIEDKGFDIDGFLLTKKELTLVVDGLDEFDSEESKRLLTHLVNLSNGIINIRVIASGRPIELQELVSFNQWNCLTTLDLTENEIKVLLKNEAIAAGLNEPAAEKDALSRWEILKSKQELLANATTPLTVCLIRDFLDESLSSKTLGDILYEVLKRRLDWTKADQKNNFASFFTKYPHTLQREKFIAPVAYKLYSSTDGKINEDALFLIVDSSDLIPKDLSDRGVIVSEIIDFVKSNFLQKIGDNYVFQSHQLHQLAVGLYLYFCISNNEEFQYKDDKINTWREISYAASIARTKGNSNIIEQYLKELIEELLFTSDNTPSAAVLLAEAQISNLNAQFLESVKKLGFRPLKFWGQSDSLVPHAYAYIIKDLGDIGFNWFFDHYINPKYPSGTGHDEVAVLILKYFLIRSQFNINENERTKLESIIRFHITAKTYSCNTLLPTVSLAIPDSFEINNRCILLTDALRKNIVKDRAEELLRKELENGEKEAVINALGIACRNKDYQPQNALELWLSIVDGDIPKLILDNCISLIGSGADELFIVLKDRVGEGNLLAYCRYSILNQNSISDAAAIILYRHFGERNPLMVGEPILKKSSWFDYKNVERERIINEVICQDGKGEQYIIRYLPNFDTRDGVPELYLKYFLKTLEESENLYINVFLYVTNYLSKFSLPRYPEIRDAFTKVLAIKEYYDALKKSLKHLDGFLRYNAASILVVCNPENEKEALEIIIRSTSKGLNENIELLRLCMKLNFSNSVLDFIHELLDDLTPISRTFAIKLLYHNNEYKLTEELINELIQGLVGNANFLDWSGNLLDDGIERVIGKERIYSHVKACLDSDQLKIKESASNSLLSYYTSKLSNKEKALCWLLNIQYYDYALVDFHNRFLNLFEEAEFVQELKDKAKEIEAKHDLKHLVFLKYYKAIKEDGDWKDFFLALLKSGRHFDSYKLEHLCGFILQIGNSGKETKEKMGKAIKELMDYPIYSQDRQYNFLLPQLAVFAHEFGELNDEEVTNILINYRISQEEVACALLYRLGSIPNGYQPERVNVEHISIFATNLVTPFNSFDVDQLGVLLEDGDDIPNNLSNVIESVILKGDLSNEQLVTLSSKSNLGMYFSIVVGFSRNHSLELQDFVKAEDIGSYKYFAKSNTQKHKEVLLKIKQTLISDNNWEKSYVEALINYITDHSKSKDVIDLFTELFALKAKFDSKLLPTLYGALIEVPYRCNLNLVYSINEYVITLTSEQQQELIDPLRKILKAINNSTNDRHENELELMSWSLSLILLYLEGKVDDDIERGFLTGLKNIFTQEGRKYPTGYHTDIQFRGRDLFINCIEIIKKIDGKLFQKIIKNGADCNVPEISAVCLMFSVFSDG
jgi:hypothetical protein